MLDEGAFVRLGIRLSTLRLSVVRLGRLPAVRRKAALALCLGFGLTFTACSSTAELQAIHAQLVELRRQVNDLQETVAVREDVEAVGVAIGASAETAEQNRESAEAEIARLLTEVRRLSAQFDESNASVQQLAANLAATNEEIATLRTSMQPAAPAVPPDRLLGIESPEELYQAAYDDYQQGAYSSALRAFRQYVEDNPDTTLADNALYWIGECHYSQGQYRRAIAEFAQVETLYPTSERMASVLLRKGSAHLQLGEASEAMQLLSDVIRRFPRSDEALLARQQLAGLENGS